STRRFEQRDALGIARRGHLSQIGVEVRRVLVGKNGGLIRRHLTDRVAKLKQKALEGKFGSRDARPGHRRTLARIAMALITTCLHEERLAVLGIARRCRSLLSAYRAGGQDQAGNGENHRLHGSLLSAAA